MKHRATVLLAALLAVGCPKKDDATGAPSASVSASAAPSVDAAPASPTTAWKGKYTAVAATLYVPDGGEFKGFKFRGDDAGDGLGEGTISLTVDPTALTIRGDVDGALGAMVVSGSRDKDDFTFSVRPKTPTDDSFFGTGSAKLEGNKVTGTLRVSRARANVIREASFALDPSPAPGN